LHTSSSFIFCDLDADNDSDDDSDDGAKEEKDEAAALFDSDDSEDDAPKKKKMKKVKRKKTKDAKKAPVLSKKERMEALRKKKRMAAGSEQQARPEKEKRKSRADMTDEERLKLAEQRKADGYDSGDSYNSGTYQRTKEDDDFIDVEGLDEDALKEFYAEQHFDDERPDSDASDSDDDGGKRKKKGKAKRKRGPDALSSDEEEEGEPDNPIMAAVHRMKKKKKQPVKQIEKETIAKALLNKMDSAADEDDQAVAERRPAMKKLSMLTEVINMLAKRDMMRVLLDEGLLVRCKRWIQPLPNGKLGNVTVRQRLLQAIGNMTGEDGVRQEDLKRSDFGKVTMSLYMHKNETPALKMQLKGLIDQWSRPIFQKSGNMKDLERVGRRDKGLVALARAQQQGSERRVSAAMSPSSSSKAAKDVTSILARGFEAKATRDLGNNRVRVPFSKGFQFTVRPTDKISSDDVKQQGRGRPMGAEGRDALSKRMLEKKRPTAKNQRSANISIEGRPAK
jgi:transcription factor SPN1